VSEESGLGPYGIEPKDGGFHIRRPGSEPPIAYSADFGQAERVAKALNLMEAIETLYGPLPDHRPPKSLDTLIAELDEMWKL
jgi:hypothetical protein